MRFLRVLSIAALVIFAASAVQADDTKVNMGGGPGGSPTCGSNTASAGNTGLLTADCLVTNTTGAVTTFSFEVLDSNTIGGGLTCVSNLTSIGWTGTLTAHNPGGVDICTLSAPSSIGDRLVLFSLGSEDDNECELEDFVLGIPVGCDVKITSATDGSGFFAPNTLVGFAVNGNELPSLPEPGTLALLLVGLTGLPLLRRKLAR